jgi:hypothetical protein
MSRLFTDTSAVEYRPVPDRRFSAMSPFAPIEMRLLPIRLM